MLGGVAVHRSRVFVTRIIPAAAIDLLKSKFDVVQWESNEPIPRDKLLAAVADGFDGLFCILTERIDSELLDKASANGNRLKVVSTMSVGYDHIDVAECHRRSIVVGHTPGVLTEATAELTVALLLCTARRLIEGVVNEVGNRPRHSVAGGIAAAGLDVCTPEPLPVGDRLLRLPNLVLVPHIGSATVGARTDMAVLAARNLVAALDGVPLPAQVLLH